MMNNAKAEKKVKLGTHVGMLATEAYPVGHHEIVGAGLQRTGVRMVRRSGVVTVDSWESSKVFAKFVPPNDVQLAANYACLDGVGDVRIGPCMVDRDFVDLIHDQHGQVNPIGWAPSLKEHKGGGRILYAFAGDYLVAMVGSRTETPA